MVCCVSSAINGLEPELSRSPLACAQPYPNRMAEARITRVFRIPWFADHVSQITFRVYLPLSRKVLMKPSYRSRKEAIATNAVPAPESRNVAPNADAPGRL